MENFSVMILDNRSHIRGAAIAQLDMAMIKKFPVFGMTRKVLLEERCQFFSYIVLYCLIEGRIEPNYITLAVLVLRWLGL